MDKTHGRLSAYPVMLIVVAVGFMLAAVACAGDPAERSAPSPTATDMDMRDQDEESAFGDPADPAEADRTVEVKMLDTLRFEPDSLEVKTGEIVTFRFINEGQIAHDATLGDEAVQHEHEREMQDMDSDDMHMDDPNAITVEPGEAGELTWRFTEPGEVLIGCHQPGHYDGGMVATVTISD